MNFSDLEQHTIILSVSELSFAIKSHLEPPFRNISVRGEITNLKFQASGHIYFSLADKESTLQAVLFRSYVTPFEKKLKEGDIIVVQGELSVYTPRGSYQILVRKIQHEGLGALLIKLEELKAKLKGLGYFNSDRKKSIPTECTRIGVITSPTGAVIKDIISVLDRRTNNSYQLTLFPVKVQGEGSSVEIAKAIRLMNHYLMADVLIVCRGGGSQDDLSAFNSESVATACYESFLPIISAVGHETDTTIIDLVADVRAPTPSVAAEIVSQHFSHILEKSKLFKSHADTALQQIIKKKQSNLVEKLRGIRQSYSAPIRLIEFYNQRLDDIKTTVENRIHTQIEKKKIQLSSRMRIVQSINPAVKIQHTSKRLNYYTSQAQKILTTRLSEALRLIVGNKKELVYLMDSIYKRKMAMYTEKNLKQKNSKAIKQYLSRYSFRLEIAKNTLTSLNPFAPLQKGYAIVFSNNRNEQKAISSKKDIHTNESICITFKDGSVKAIITESE